MNRRVIRSSAREIMIMRYMIEEELDAGQLLSDINDVYKRIAEMSGKHRSRRPKKTWMILTYVLSDNFQSVQFFYTVKKIAPTLLNLLLVVREELGYDGSCEHLRKVLLALGFRYKKCQSDREALMEKLIIAAKCEVYLDIIMKSRNLPDNPRKDIVYLDESYVHASYKLKKCWQSLNCSGIKHLSKGKRYIIIHARNENGFLPNALLIFNWQNKNEDYHSEMNKINFTKWVKENLVPNLSKPAIIVMDNAPYHSVVLNKAPTSASKISEIRQWLIEINILYEDSTSKPNLLMFIKKHKPEPVF